jgi:hypothetical protein
MLSKRPSVVYYFARKHIGMERPSTSLCYWDVVTPVIGLVQTPAEVSRDGVFFFMELLPKTKAVCNWVTLSVAEAELVSATSCAQSLLFHYKLLTDLGLRVQLPMILDNKGTKDVVCNWSAGGCMRHFYIRQFFLRDLKEDGIVRTKWIPTADNSADLFTKNLFGPLFEKHIRTYVGFDDYMEHERNDKTIR